MIETFLVVFYIIVGIGAGTAGADILKDDPAGERRFYTIALALAWPAVVGGLLVYKCDELEHKNDNA